MTIVWRILLVVVFVLAADDTVVRPGTGKNRVQFSRRIERGVVHRTRCRAV